MKGMFKNIHKIIFDIYIEKTAKDKHKQPTQGLER